MVYCYWTSALLFDEKYCYSLLMDELMLLHTMQVLTSGGMTSMMLLLRHAVGPLDKNSNDSTDGDCGTMFILLFSYLGSSSGIPTR